VGGDKGAMGRMVRALEKGEERDEELVRRFEGMRAYLEKRDEQAGEWVLQVCPFVCLSTSSSSFRWRSRGVVHGVVDYRDADE